MFNGRAMLNVPPVPPCHVCGAEPLANHKKDCQHLAAMRAQAYPMILDDNGMRWEHNHMSRLNKEIARLRTALEAVIIAANGAGDTHIAGIAHRALNVTSIRITNENT